MNRKQSCGVSGLYGIGNKRIKPAFDPNHILNPGKIFELNLPHKL